MANIFLTILNISITASYIALAALVLRLLLKRNPKWITCILWALLAIRLLVPFSFESKLSLIPSAEPVKSQSVLSSADAPIDNNYETLAPQAPIIEQENPDSVQSPVTPITPDKSEDTPAENIAPATPQTPKAEDSKENKTSNIFSILSYVWAGGVLLMLLYSVISFVRLKRRVRASFVTDKNIYICDDISTPFILGIIKPRIYLPSTLSGDELEYITSHEKAHLKRLDHLWKPLGFLLLSVHWFNPLMWVSYILLCRDIELACDEKVLKSLGTDSKKHYSQTLLTFSTERKLVSACPLAFGEVGVKQRIKNILNYKKPAFWVILLSLLLCLAIGLCFLTNPVSDKENNNTTETTDTDADEINILSKDHSYILKATELIYNNPVFNYIQDVGEAPTYRLVNCSQLHEIAHSSNGYKTKLIADTYVSELYGSFDSTFRFGNDGFSEGYSIESLRENNLSTLCAENDTYYYQILKQKDNTHYLVVGHIADTEAPKPDEELYSESAIITAESDRYVRWIYKVEVKEAKNASLMLPEPENEEGYIDYSYQDESALRNPNVRLYPKSKSFEFFIHSLSSLLPTGNYEIENSKLILIAEGVSNQTYVFNIIDSDNLEFVESDSSPIPTYKISQSAPSNKPFEDGAVFTKLTENEYTNITDLDPDYEYFTKDNNNPSILYDIDSDGEEEMVLIGNGLPSNGVVNLKIGALKLDNGKVTDEIYNQKALYLNHINVAPFHKDFKFYITDDGKLRLEGYSNLGKTTVDVVFINYASSSNPLSTDGKIFLAENGLGISSMAHYARFDIDSDGIDEDCVLAFRIASQSSKPYIIALEKGSVDFEGFVVCDDENWIDLWSNNFLRLFSTHTEFRITSNSLQLVVRTTFNKPTTSYYYDISYESNKIIATKSTRG
ncbi:MAG: M56 family metallopeptidase [Ruminococcaceae bacterium]|nr:M56 family metallopeptidase [Oscillospiraceae bacterium]